MRVTRADLEGVEEDCILLPCGEKKDGNEQSSTNEGNQLHWISNTETERLRELDLGSVKEEERRRKRRGQIWKY